MLKTKLLFVSSIIALFVLLGCVQNDIRRPQQNYGYNQGKQQNQQSWAEQTNLDEESIDISDLDENITESQTDITETQEPQKLARIAFPVAEYNRLAKTGKATISGSIYVNDSYGKKIVGSGTRLYLNPVTSYSNQWYRDSYIGGAKMQKADSRLFNYLRFTAANADGQYAFYGVPAGSYYLIGTVKCGTECGYDTPKSIRIATKVSVSGNEVLNQDLSKMLD
jgi:hypothetical protein